MKMIFHSYANETHFHKEDFALRLILKVRVFWHSKMAYQIPPTFLSEKKGKGYDVIDIYVLLTCY